MITLTDVTKIYKSDGCETQALKGISLEIKDGEWISIVGTSGSGKSTLLNLIGCMDTLTEGSYVFNDIEVHKLKGNELHTFRKENVSFIFQHFALMNHYTVYENAELPLMIKNVSQKKRKEIVMENLELMGIADLAKKKPSNISGGQQQRCAIARALSSQNNLILADEPTGALDKNTGIEIMEVLDALNKKGKTLVVVTHDENVAKRANRIIRVEDGRCY